MDACDVISTYDQIIGLKINDRKKIQGISNDRSDIIAGGLAPLKALMDIIGTDKLIISGNGLRQGAFYKHFYDLCDMKNEVADDVLNHSINNTLKKYDANIPHSNHVSMLSLKIFDQLFPIHGLDAGFRKLLTVAARLHDIGLYVDYYDHHSHGFYLALIIALHRNENFKRTWSEFKLYIDKFDYNAILRLGMIVRIAEGLDRNEYGNVEDIKCSVSDKDVKLLITAKRFAMLEIAAVTLSSKPFKKLFGRELLIDCVQSGKPGWFG
jgi:exopolyphosphatase/guanosine-5'-triphosphate,3'-diphosphate pyrophosphatase